MDEVRGPPNRFAENSELFKITCGNQRTIRRTRRARRAAERQAAARAPSRAGSFARWASAFVVAGAGQEVFDFGGIAAHTRSQERKRARHRVSTGGCVRPIELTRGDSELARFGLTRARVSTTAHLPFAAAAARGAGSRVTVAVPRAGSG